MFFFICFKHKIEVEVDKMHFECAQNAEKVSQSPKFSLALSMYSSDFEHKIEVTRSR